MENGECPFLSSIRHLQPACGGCGQDDQAQMSPVTPASLHCWECWLSRGKGYPMSCRKFIWQKQRRERVQSNLSGWITRILIFFKYHPPRSTVPFKISPPPRHTAMTTVLPSLCSSQAGLLHGLTCLLPMRSIPYVSQLLVCASQIHWTASTNFCLGKYLKLCHSPPSGFLF